MHELALPFVAQAEPWVAAPHQAILAAVLGAGIGVLGGIYGTMLGLLVPRGRGKRFVYALHWGFLGLGVVLVAVGITALATRQPYGVWYAFLLPGLIATSMLAVFTPLLARIWYRQAEQRRLEAEEFRRG
jgi:MFS family permease